MVAEPMSLTTPERTAAIVASLEQRYPLPEWTLVTELRLSAGWSGSEQRLDALAINCWPSKNHIRLGFEVKASRGDLLRDLRSHKWKGYLPFVHQFYFVLPREVPFGWNEVPDEAGVIRWNGRGVTMTITKGAPTNDDPPQNGPSFWVSAVRRALYMPQRQKTWY